jgi:hypothetical protein
MSLIKSHHNNAAFIPHPKHHTHEHSAHYSVVMIWLTDNAVTYFLAHASYHCDLPLCFANFLQLTMCFRKGIKYACPDHHTLLNTVEPFTLCVLAQHYPIPRQCASIVNRFENSEEWCIDCWMKDYGMREALRESQRVFASRNESGKNRPRKGHHVRGDSWRDDVPQ